MNLVLTGDLNDPSMTSYEIRRRLGALSDPRFILANNGWLGKVGTDSRHLSSAIPMPSYTFVLPGKDDMVLSVPTDHLAIYQLALDAGLRFPLHSFIGRLLHYYYISHK